ncbi:hypothetical protein K458DRAFT_174238 [Lentithecium fluviatile CBS 122367]|uniref:Uncharacterized protein n=1 Tax=Lentithecium fluviatile CBS 122367 TaxID=1168545 RepID=A0A6G1JBV6_9PLEO|nr:hypothetical protein K458DRAFT_174238 [Lentithecium fluviatile CBS 122367]
MVKTRRGGLGRVVELRRVCCMRYVWRLTAAIFTWWLRYCLVTVCNALVRWAGASMLRRLRQLRRRRLGQHLNLNQYRMTRKGGQCRRTAWWKGETFLTRIVQS